MPVKVVCAISILISMLSITALILYKRQVKSICRQIRFLNENPSNMEVTKDIDSKEIGELADTVNDLLKKFSDERLEINHKDNSLREIITNISHDIRTPLTSLNGYFDLLSQADNEEEYQKYAAIIKERIECLKEMLEQLFTYVKLQNNEYEFEHDEFDVCKELCSTLVEFYEEFKKKNIEPILSVPDEIWMMRLNKLAFRRIFENIIKNSIEHGSSYFELTMTKNADAITVIIKNDIADGGITKHSVERVFERFYKADKSRSQNSTGLGLAIAHDMVCKMNGNIKAEIEEDLFVIKVELFGFCL